MKYMLFSAFYIFSIDTYNFIEIYHLEIHSSVGVKLKIN